MSHTTLPTIVLEVRICGMCRPRRRSGTRVADEPNTTWIYCNRCKTPTRHILVASYGYNFSPLDEEGSLASDSWGEYRLWRCAGCDTGTMEDHWATNWNDVVEEGKKETDGHFYQSTYYPKRQHEARPRKYFMKVPPKLDNLYGEVLSSLNEEQPLLCAAGLRALVEGVCADKQITGRNLENKIEGMTKLLPKNIVKNLHGFRFIGNRAVHELEAPDKDQLRLAMDVIEDILNFLYSLDYKASLLGKAIASQGKKPAPPRASLLPEDARGPDTKT